MALVQDGYANRGRPVLRQQQAGHQRGKSSALRTFLHRRNNSEGDALPALQASPSLGSLDLLGQHFDTARQPPRSRDLVTSGANHGALGELQQSRSPRKQYGGEEIGPAPSSPTKTLMGLGLRTGRRQDDGGKCDKGIKDRSPHKTKSTTSLA